MYVVNSEVYHLHINWCMTFVLCLIKCQCAYLVAFVARGYTTPLSVSISTVRWYLRVQSTSFKHSTSNSCKRGFEPCRRQRRRRWKTQTPPKEHRRPISCGATRQTGLTAQEHRFPMLSISFSASPETDSVLTAAVQLVGVAYWLIMTLDLFNSRQLNY